MKDIEEYESLTGDDESAEQGEAPFERREGTE